MKTLNEHTYLELLELRKEVDAEIASYNDKDKRPVHCVVFCDSSEYYFHYDNAKKEAQRILNVNEGFKYRMELSIKNMTDAEIVTYCLDINDINEIPKL